MTPGQDSPDSMLHWFAAPELPSPDLRRHARALWIASWPFFAVVASMLTIAVIVEPETLVRRATTIAAVGVLIALLHAMSRAGRPALASWMLVLGLSAIVTQRAWITGGIHAPVAVFYALFIVMAGVLIGVRGGIATAAACALGAILLTTGTAFHWLAVHRGAGSALGALVFVMLSIGLALVVQTIHRLRGGGLGTEAVQMLVHDMRSPIQILLTHLELLREGIRGDSTRDVEEAIDGATTLGRMTDSLLDVSRFEAGRMPIHRAAADLSALARSVVGGLRVLQPTRHVSVVAEGEVVCRCDAELTRRILENLVSNAMKHTSIEGRVRVTVSTAGDKARIEVRDEGPGVPLDKRALIFEPYNAPALRTPTGYRSSGLGLAFCKLAVEAQGGVIRVEDAAPRGSAFIVELPC
ncbi:MAG: sensor histidine kinase [Vicinamibacterales bacterium]